MWLPLTLVALVGAVSANYEHGWKAGNEYNYLVRSRTFTGLDKLSDQYTGILMKAILKVQRKDPETLRAAVSKAQYANVHNKLPGGWDSQISDQMLELREMQLSGKPFEIKMKHGVIRDLIVDREVPTWEVNVLKSIVSQLQVDTQGENAKRSKVTQIPTDEEPYGVFKAMEDSVGGKCEVLYDITPLQEYIYQTKPELVPLPHLKGDGQHIDIVKTKNFSRCEDRIDYHFGIPGDVKWEPGSNENGKFFSKSSTSRIVISGNLKNFAIQSSVTTSKMFIRPHINDNGRGIVVSKMNLTLATMTKISNTLNSPSNPESIGNLVYVYNSPYSDGNERRPSKISESPNSRQDSSSASSSEEKKRNGVKRYDSSSSSSSSSDSMSKEREFWQPKPTLEDAPQNPLLPKFIGYKGKTIWKSSEIDPVKSVKELVQEMSHELDDPSSIPSAQTLEKFTILTSLIRTMDRKQIREAVSDIRVSQNELKWNEKSQSKKQQAWAVIRDAVTQAGTGPALLTIKDWIEKKQIEGMEAADLVTRIPKTARAPTDEYVHAVFEMARNPEVLKDKHLGPATILAFTELVRKCQVNMKSMHNRYPVHSFGRLTSKNDRTILEEYIPFLSKLLRKAIKDGDSVWIQTAIMALGNMGHPKMLAVFEPFLEGKEQVSPFQRTLMVLSMAKLAKLYPKLARSVLYKIYLNTMDVHEIRCAAVFMLMKTDPPLSMLQRMAEFTNYDTNKHVNSAVKSSIESIADLEIPETRDLANRARAAKHLLNPKDISYQYSRGYVTDGLTKRSKMAYRMILNYIGSDDSPIPRAFYGGIDTDFGGSTTRVLEVAGMVSSVKDLVDIFMRKGKDNDATGKSQTEMIAEALNIEGGGPEQLEGNLLWNSKQSSRFFAFDNHTIERMPGLAMDIVESLKDERYSNMNKMFSTDVILSFPTETGLPFVYALKTPTLYKLSTSARAEIRHPPGARIKSDVRLVMARKIQGTIGFVAPFDHSYYISGVDVNYQAYIPVRVEANVDVPKKSMELKLWPLNDERNVRLLHASTTPFTSRHDILNLRPLLTDKNTHKIQTREPESISQYIPWDGPKSFRIDMEGDDLNNGQVDRRSDNPFARFDYFSHKYFQFDVFMNLQKEQKEPVVLTVAVDSMDAKSDSEDLGEWSSKAKAVRATTKEPNSDDRKKQFLQEAAKGIKLAKSNVIDLRLDVPGEFSGRNILTLAWADSNVEKKVRTLLYWNFDFPKQDITHEVCAAGQVTAMPNPLLDFEKTIAMKPKMDFDFDIRYGRNCLGDGQITVKGDATQSKELRDKIRESRVAMKCREQMKEGDKALRGCQQASAAVMVLDELQMSLELHSKPLQTFANLAVHTVKDMNLIEGHVNALNPRNAEKDKIDIRAKFSSHFDKATVTVHTSDMDLTYSDIDVSDLAIEGLDLRVADDNMDLKDVAEDQEEQSCALDSTRIETFDSRTYPLRLGKCWHVIMTTFQKRNPDNRDEKLRIPEDMRVTVLARETDNGEKEVKVILGESEIRLSPSGSLGDVTVDGKKVLTSKDSKYQEKRNDEIEFQIFRLSDDSIALKSDKYEVDAVYDGKRILIKASDSYRNSVRGLCGNFNGEEEDDFMGPKDCMLTKVDEFTATYAMIKNECEGSALENARRSHKFECIPKMYRLSDVINDKEAGRSMSVNGNWGYHQDDRRDEKQCSTHRTKVAMVNDKVCFSIRPLPTCADRCLPIETKTKNYPFHCMPKNQASLELKKRVEKGANPDLSQKTPSLSQTIEVPLGCRA